MVAQRPIALPVNQQLKFLFPVNAKNVTLPVLLAGEAITKSNALLVILDLLTIVLKKSATKNALPWICINRFLLQ